MAEDGKAEENNYWRTDISSALGLEPFKRSSVMALKAALKRFKHNKEKWESGDPADKLCLVKHLAFTIMVPGGKASQCRKAVGELHQIGMLSPGSTVSAILRDDLVKTVLIAETISGKVRFHNQKATRLVHAMNHWDEIRTIAHDRLTGSASVSTTRDRLIDEVHGFGNKAASHFMRNTGLMSGWRAEPIVDTHILKALNKLGYPCNGYGESEESFELLARKWKVEPLLLDAVLWCAYARNWDIDNSDFDNLIGI